MGWRRAFNSFIDWHCNNGIHVNVHFTARMRLVAIATAGSLFPQIHSSTSSFWSRVSKIVAGTWGGEGRMLSKEGAGWRGAERPRGFGNSALDHRTVFPERISQSYLSITRSAKMTGYDFHGMNSKLRSALIGSHRTDFVLKGCFSETNYLCLREITQWKNSGPNFRGCGAVCCSVEDTLNKRRFLLFWTFGEWSRGRESDDGVPALLKLTHESVEE